MTRNWWRYYACHTVCGGYGVQEPLLHLLFEEIISTLINSVLWVKGLTKAFKIWYLIVIISTRTRERKALDLMCYWTGFSTETKVQGRAVVYRISTKWKVFPLLFLLFGGLMLFGWSEIFNLCSQAFLIAANKTIQGWVVVFFFTVAFLGFRLKGLRIAADSLSLDRLLQVDMLSWSSGSPDCQKGLSAS